MLTLSCLWGGPPEADDDDEEDFPGCVVDDDDEAEAAEVVVGLVVVVLMEAMLLFRKLSGSSSMSSAKSNRLGLYTDTSLPTNEIMLCSVRYFPSIILNYVCFLAQSAGMYTKISPLSKQIRTAVL